LLNSAHRASNQPSDQTGADEGNQRGWRAEPGHHPPIGLAGQQAELEHVVGEMSSMRAPLPIHRISLPPIRFRDANLPGGEKRGWSNPLRECFQWRRRRVMIRFQIARDGWPADSRDNEVSRRLLALDRERCCS